MSETDNSDVSFATTSDDETILDHDRIEQQQCDVATSFEPYQDEPLASSSSSEGLADDDPDIDGIPFEALEARYERRVPIEEWCHCGKCSVEGLVASREYRCCWEVQQAIGQLVFQGTAEELRCVTNHPDFSALSNKTVLKLAGSLFKTRDGKCYKRQANQTENEFLRAVAYRWLIRWMFGFLGYDNARPLPACIYKFIRERFPTGAKKGYKSSQQRDLVD
ncbi:uncharacterized protein LOC135690367 [Rhopilema esculentum]|uniref:uncharacterized protein LOC135682940 n=1 Tax=Rhopilema esculentum TaxID=499914 RepID=UPI0031DEEE11